MMNERVFTVKEAARFLRCSPRSLEDPAWRQSIGLPAVRIGRAVRFLKSDLLIFLEGQREVLATLKHAEQLGKAISMER